jgi:recombination protein RecT
MAHTLDDIRTATAAPKPASTQVATRKKRTMADILQLEKKDQLPAMLEAFQGEIARALPSHLHADRMARIALTSFRQTPKLAECEPASVFACVVQAAQLGLEPGLLGQCYLLPFKNNRQNRMECQLQVGYQGLVDLVRRSGTINSLEVHAVYSNDKFRATWGLNPVLEHEPNWDGERGTFRLAYAIATFKDGGRHIEIMSKSEIDKIRDRSQNVQSAKKYSKTTPWDTDYEEMAKKTVIRRITKMLPKSVELAYAVNLSDRADRGITQALNVDDAIDGVYTVVDDEPEAIEAPADAAPARAESESDRAEPEPEPMAEPTPAAAKASGKKPRSVD